MKGKIENKIEAIIDFILNKPEEKITQDDYSILSTELRDIRFRESEADNEKRIKELMAFAFPANSCASTKQ